MLKQAISVLSLALPLKSHLYPLSTLSVDVPWLEWLEIWLCSKAACHTRTSLHMRRLLVCLVALIARNDSHVAALRPLLSRSLRNEARKGGSSFTTSQQRSYTSPLMPRGVKKEHLPEKICVVCNRPFTWRKKWERCWEEVTTCSKSCNAKRRAAAKQQSAGAEGQS